VTPSDPWQRSMQTAAMLLGLVALAGVGCSAVNPSLTSEPRVAVEGLTLRSIGPDAAEGDVMVRLWVDRGEPIQLDDYQYVFRVDGRTVFSGRWAALAAAPPEDPIVRSLPVVIPLGLLSEETRLAVAAPPTEPAADDRPSIGGTGTAGTSTRAVPFNWSVSGSVGWADAARLSKILLDLGFANPRTDFSGRGDQMRLPVVESPR
jgi:hypothetical protein